MSNLTAHQETLLRRWVAGELNRREEAELEALAREDDFLAEALAGLRAEPGADHSAALSRLRSRLQQPQRDGGAGWVWRRLAAAVLLLLVAGAAVWLWPAFGVETAAEMADSATEAVAAPPAEEPERATKAPLADVSPRTETARAASPVPAPRREQMKATNSTAPESTPPARPDELAVTSAVPADVLPPAPPPPPPPPPPAPMGEARDFAQRQSTPAAVSRRTESAAKMEPAPPAPSQPVPYSVGARAIAADTPNAVPTDAEDSGDVLKNTPRMTTLIRPQGAGRMLRGYVRDDSGDPLPGVMVTTPGVPAGLFTDSTGYFELRVDRNVDRLEFRNTGYRDEEIAVEGEDAYFEITLDEAVTESVSADEAFAKTTIIPNDRPTMVSPPGGYRQLRRQLQSEKPAELPVGRVRLEFTVTADGKLQKFKVLETPDKQLSRWLIDRLRQTGDWTFYHGQGPHTVRYSVRFE